MPEKQIFGKVHLTDIDTYLLSNLGVMYKISGNHYAINQLNFIACEGF